MPESYYYEDYYGYYYDYHESTADLILCKWFDAGTSSLEISFTSDGTVTKDGVKILAACVATNDQFANRLDWSQRHLTTNGDCSNGTTKSNRFFLILLFFINLLSGWRNNNYNDDDDNNNNNNNNNYGDQDNYDND